MVSGKPRTLRVLASERPVVLFTDGAYEPADEGRGDGSTGAATIGGVLFLPDGTVRVFGCEVDPEVLQAWLEGSEHPIGLIELYAIVTAFKLFKNFLCQKRVLLFGDNWAANDVFVRGSSAVRSWRVLLLVLEKLDQEIEPLAWLGRVPSASNVADPPSRGSIKELMDYLPELENNVECPVTSRRLRNLKLK